MSLIEVKGLRKSFGTLEVLKDVDVFDSPKREKTVSFIRKIKFFSFDITQRSFDLMQLEVSYAEADRASEIMFSCGGKAYDPFAQGDDELGVTILKRMGRMTKYLRENGRNKITVVL